jgi:hypothetical protein
MTYYYELLIESHPGLVGVAIVLASGLVGHFPVVWFLWVTNFLRPTPEGEPKFARWIGIFERFAITLFVLLDSLGGAVFIFGLKTAVMSWRVDKNDNQRRIVEYVLIGTLVSFVVAVAVGLAGRGLLGLPLVRPPA